MLYIKKRRLGGEAYGSVYHATIFNWKKKCVLKVTELTGKEKADFYNRQELKIWNNIQKLNTLT